MNTRWPFAPAPLLRSAAVTVAAVALSFQGSGQGQNGAATGFVEAGDDQRLFYRIDGSGPGRIVVLHGGPGMSFAYLQPELTELAAEHQLIYYDQRGGGFSTLTSQPDLLHADAHVEDLEAVRRHFGIERLTLLGHSWGAGLAALYSSRYPENVERLILVSAMPPRLEPYLAQFEHNLFAWMDAATRLEFDRREAARTPVDSVKACEEFWELFNRAYLANRDRPPPFRGGPCNVPVEALQNEATVMAATLESLGEWDWRPQIAALRVPTLVIHGAKDPIPVEAAREWASTLRNATLRVIEDSGHHPFVEQRPMFLQAVERFLDETSR